MATELARERIEISLRCSFALLQHDFERMRVLLHLADFIACGLQQGEEVLPEFGLLPIRFFEAVEAVFSRAAITDQPGSLELAELGGDVRLRQREHFLQFGHAEFLALQQQ